MASWYDDVARQSRVIERPRAVAPRSLTNDTTGAIVIGAQAAGYNQQLIGSNINRNYLLIQNNTTVNISLAVGNGPSSTGLIILPGGYYERQIYCFPQAVFVTLIAASATNDYISYEEGTNVSL